MSEFKNKLGHIINKFIGFFTNLKRGLAARWSSLSPGFRYALVYFVCVVCIASVVWWQFNPGSSLVFDPDAHDRTSPNDPLDTAEEDLVPTENPGVEPDVFSPQNGDKLLIPMQGETLAAFGDTFQRLPGLIMGGIDGVHIDGTMGDEVCSAWLGVVSQVIPPGPYDPGEVRVQHGDWYTVYKNLEDIVVSEGQTVQTGQVLGELSAKLFGPYAGDYLEFQVWGPNDVAYDPWEYLGVHR